MSDEAATTFCVEDTCGLKDDNHMIGVIDRTFTDVDSHSAAPQRDYPERIQKHKDIPDAEFAKFLRTGIPPRGTVLISWQTDLKSELIPEKELVLLDRALFLGDIVKKDAQSPLSGTVVGMKAACTLCPVGLLREPNFTPDQLTPDQFVQMVPSEELVNAHEYHEGSLVIYDDWVGRVEGVYEEVAMRLGNGSVVVVDNPEELVPDDGLIDHISVGDTVKSKKGNLRRGRWKYGAYEPNVPPVGTVVEVRPVALTVHWLCRRLGGGSTPAAMPGAFPLAEPPSDLDVDALESGNVRMYDSTLVPPDQPTKHRIVDVTVGDRVRFKDLSGACVKYQGKVKRIPREETLGYDMNVFVVMQTYTTVTVLWQDLTITECGSTALIPDPNLDDEDEVWPGEIVCTKERKLISPPDGSASDEEWAFEPAKVGVVQSVRATDRIASVRWFSDASVKFVGDDLLPGSRTGPTKDWTEDVSLYDIRSSVGLNRRRGDFVIVHSNALESTDSNNTYSGINWFGEIVDLGCDGLITVRLGAADPVKDIKVPAESVTLVYSGDMADDFYSDNISEDEDTSMADYSDQSDESSWDGEVVVEYRGNGGAAIGDDTGDEAWSTEDEEDDDDESMIDEENVDTSKTSPGSEPEVAAAVSEKPGPSAEPRLDGASEPQESPEKPSVQPNSPDAISPNVGPSFTTLDTPPPEDHHFLSSLSSTSPTLLRRIAREHRILSSSLPSGIYVRTWDSRLDLLRVLILGPADTPYEYAPFMIDLYLGPSFPSSPPEAFFHSWTNGMGPVNPNLYEDGKICLSLLGTWHTDERNESWNEKRSTVLQILVSLQSLVLVREPYYNEAGYDVRHNTPESAIPSALYTERAYFRSRAFIAHALRYDPEPFSGLLMNLYLAIDPGYPQLLQKALTAAREIVANSEGAGEEEEGLRDGLRKVSKGAVIALKRQIEAMEPFLKW